MQDKNKPMIPVYSEPNTSSDVAYMAFNGETLQALGEDGDFVEVRVPQGKSSGYLVKSFAVPIKPENTSSVSTLTIVIAVLVLIAGGVAAALYLRARKGKGTMAEAASGPQILRQAEDLFRSGDYIGATREFDRYVQFQDGDIRQPEVYRRLMLCHQNNGDLREALEAWRKARSMGALKTYDDYVMGVELSTALNKEPDAAEIYEHLLTIETDDEKRFDIHKNLLESYRRLKNGPRAIHHSLELRKFGTADPSVLVDLANFLLVEGQTDLAIESNDKELLLTVCREMAEDKSKTPEAGRIYLKCLEYDRMDTRLHRLLADIYNYGGDYKRAVSELTILTQIDKDATDAYMDEAAKIYVDNGKIKEALAEGNPAIVKKIAQSFLLRSEITDEAVAVYEKVLEFQPRAIGINKMLSIHYLRSGDLSKYMDRLRLLHEIDGASHDYLADLAQCIIDNNFIDEAIKDGNRELNTKILKQLVKKGATTDAAVSLLEKLSKMEPTKNEYRIAHARTKDKRGELDKCFQQLLTIIPQRPDDEVFCNRAAEIAVEKGYLKTVAGESSPKLIVSAAYEIMHKKAQGPEVNHILAAALRERPHDRKIRNYWNNMAGDSGVFPLDVPPEPAEELTERTAAAQEIQEKPQTPTPKVPPALNPAVKPAPPPKPQKQAPAPPKPATGPSVTKPTQTQKRPKSASASPPKQSPTQNAEQPKPPQSPQKTAPPLEPKSPKEPPVAAKGQKGPRAIQTISLSDQGVSFSEKAVTTFVSGYAKGQSLREIPMNELFLPADGGGLAYKEMEILTQDGWGRIHIGAEVNTSRPVLMRIFEKGLLDEPTMKQFVATMTSISYSLVHPNVAKLEDVVSGTGGKTAFVYPFYPKTLEILMKRKKPVDLGRRLKFLSGIIEGLAYAHNHKGADGKFRRIFHLHLQPNQILLDENFENPAIVGLGFSQTFRNLTHAKYPRYKEPGMHPSALPPEFFISRIGNIRERSADIYSLGVLMYYVVTGDYPFEGPSFDDYKFQHTKIFPAPPRLIDSGLPDWIDAVVLGCLEKEPEKRWDTVMEIGRALGNHVK